MADVAIPIRKIMNIVKANYPRLNGQQITNFNNYLTKGAHPRVKKSLANAVDGKVNVQTIRTHVNQWLGQTEGGLPSTTPQTEEGDGWTRVPGRGKQNAASAESANSPKDSEAQPSQGKKPTRNNSRGSNTRKGATNTIAWSDYVVSNENPLILADRSEAHKTNVRAEDSDRDILKAKGYTLLQGYLAKKFIKRCGELIKNGNILNDMVIILPHMQPNELDEFKAHVGDFEAEVNNSALDEDWVQFEVQTEALLLQEPETESTKVHDVVLLQMNAAKPIVLCDSEEAQHLGKVVIPELEYKSTESISMMVTIVKPLAEEVGMREWTDKIFSLKSVAEMAGLIREMVLEGKKDPNLKIQVHRNRSYRLHNKELEESIIRASFTTRLEEVTALLKRSGKYGILFDFAERHRKDLRMIKMPLDMDLQDCLNMVEESPTKDKDLMLGIVPSFRGYMVRALPENVARVTEVVDPAMAEELGDALDLQPSGEWLLKNLPRTITKNEIIKTLNSNGPFWTPWRILPKKTIPDKSSRGATWIVEAEEPPPRKSVRFQRHSIVTIERYTDAKAMRPKARIWATPIMSCEVKPKSPTPKRTPWADTYDEENGEDDNNIDIDGQQDGHTEEGHEQEQAEQGESGTRNLWQRQPDTGTNSWRPARAAQTTKVPWIGLETSAARRPRHFDIANDSSESSEDVRSRPPEWKRRCGDARTPVNNARRNLHSKSPVLKLDSFPQQRGPLEETDPQGGNTDNILTQQRKIFEAALADKDKAIAGLQASLNGLQAMIAHLIQTMAMNGNITAEVAQASIAQAQTVVAINTAEPIVEEHDDSTDSMWHQVATEQAAETTPY